MLLTLNVPHQISKCTTRGTSTPGWEPLLLLYPKVHALTKNYQRSYKSVMSWTMSSRQSKGVQLLINN